MFQRWPDPNHEPIPWDQHDLALYSRNLCIYLSLSILAWSVPFWYFDIAPARPGAGDLFFLIILTGVWFVSTGIVTVRMFQELVSVVAVVGYRVLKIAKARWKEYQKRRAEADGSWDD